MRAGSKVISASFTVSLHALIAVLLLIVAANVSGGSRFATATAIGALALFVVTYVAGLGPGGAILAPGRRGRWWIFVLSVEWLVLLATSVEATYLVFPLFFLYIRVLGAAWGTAIIAVATGIAIGGFGSHRGFDLPGVIGPILGAAVAVVIGSGYLALMSEAQQRQRLIEELTQTRSQLAAAERAAGVLDERERLAREIHDTVSQSLSSIIMLLHTAQRSGSYEHVEQARDAAADALAETREFIHALSPPTLRSGGIWEALSRLARSTHEATGLQVEVTVPQPIGSLPTPVEAAMLRIAQSALANVAQHANATRVDLTLTRLAEDVILDVVDDGDGFDPEQPAMRSDHKPSFGLAAMRDRTVTLGGTFVVESSRGNGTSVVARFGVGS